MTSHHYTTSTPNNNNNNNNNNKSCFQGIGYTESWLYSRTTLLKFKGFNPQACKERNVPSNTFYLSKISFFHDIVCFQGNLIWLKSLLCKISLPFLQFRTNVFN